MFTPVTRETSNSISKTLTVDKIKVFQGYSLLESWRPSKFECPSIFCYTCATDDMIHAPLTVWYMFMTFSCRYFKYKGRKCPGCPKCKEPGKVTIEEL